MHLSQYLCEPNRTQIFEFKYAPGTGSNFACIFPDFVTNYVAKIYALVGPTFSLEPR